MFFEGRNFGTEMKGRSRRAAFFVLLCTSFVLTFAGQAVAVTALYTTDDDKTVIVNDAPDQEVYVFGRNVIVKKQAKGVLAIGGDVIVEGRVTGDVATIGGNVIQEKDAYIGGDVIVFGGSYRPAAEKPLREDGKETIMFAVFEDQFRNIGQNPSQMLNPEMSTSFFAQRFVLALFWFLLSMVVTTIAPGAVSRAATRIRLSWFKSLAAGAGALLLIVAMIVGAALTLPEYLGITIFLMGIVVVLLGYVFGRVALHVALGKVLTKRFNNGNNRSETLSILVGVILMSVLISLPYIWVIVLFAVLSIGLGLFITARNPQSAQNAAG
jgi:hypothetical protein